MPSPLADGEQSPRLPCSKPLILVTPLFATKPGRHLSLELSTVVEHQCAARRDQAWTTGLISPCALTNLPSVLLSARHKPRDFMSTNDVTGAILDPSDEADRLRYINTPMSSFYKTLVFPIIGICAIDSARKSGYMVVIFYRSPVITFRP